ncbi:hypothetical protein JCM11641_007932 [Rhodosporidiobolus odoratus]
MLASLPPSSSSSSLPTSRPSPPPTHSHSHAHPPAKRQRTTSKQPPQDSSESTPTSSQPYTQPIMSHAGLEGAAPPSTEIVTLTSVRSRSEILPHLSSMALSGAREHTEGVPAGLPERLVGALQYQSGCGKHWHGTADASEAWVSFRGEVPQDA